MRLYSLNRTVLSIRNNPSRFLNGLTSNTLNRPRNAFLNIHGRIIATFDQIKISDDEFWAVVEMHAVKALSEHLERYLKLSNTQLKPLEKHVYYDIDGQAAGLPGDCIVSQQKAGRTVISDKTLNDDVTEEEWVRFRLDHDIPVQGKDYTDEFVLNVTGEDVVSYDKGCFLGQEPVAKVHNRSSPTWQLVVKYGHECTEEELAKMTSKATDASGRVRGFVFVNNKAEGKESK